MTNREQWMILHERWWQEWWAANNHKIDYGAVVAAFEAGAFDWIKERKVGWND